VLDLSLDLSLALSLLLSPSIAHTRKLTTTQTRLVPTHSPGREIRRYPNAEVVWCQEEPMNMGAYAHIQPRLLKCIEVERGRDSTPLRIPYSGRKAMAATSTGFASVHAAEQAQLIDSALTI
jgi:2-oxoglutarate dehydrogenase complex dehydrogenase (E1) component-like enzyme